MSDETSLLNFPLGLPSNLSPQRTILQSQEVYIVTHNQKVKGKEQKTKKIK